MCSEDQKKDDLYLVDSTVYNMDVFSDSYIKCKQRSKQFSVIFAGLYVINGSGWTCIKILGETKGAKENV